MKSGKLAVAVTILVLLVFVGATIFNSVQKNKAEERADDLKQENKQLEQENKNLEKQISSGSDDKQNNTFEDDISWFTKKIYTLENRKKLYEDVKASASEGVLKDLFGEDLPPNENQGEVESIDREVSNMEVYGQYKDNNHYKSIVTFDLNFNNDSVFTVVQVNLMKQDDTWLVSHFEEYLKGS